MPRTREQRKALAADNIRGARRNLGTFLDRDTRSLESAVFLSQTLLDIIRFLEVTEEELYGDEN